MARNTGRCAVANPFYWTGDCVGPPADAAVTVVQPPVTNDATPEATTQAQLVRTNFSSVAAAGTRVSSIHPARRCRRQPGDRPRHNGLPNGRADHVRVRLTELIADLAKGRATSGAACARRCWRSVTVRSLPHLVALIRAGAPLRTDRSSSAEAEQYADRSPPADPQCLVAH